MYPTSYSSSTTPGTPFIPRRPMSNSNSRVSLLHIFCCCFLNLATRLRTVNGILTLFYISALSAYICLFYLFYIILPTFSVIKYPVSEMEESMLSALRPPEHTSAPHNVPPRYTSTSASAAHNRLSTDPSELPPDRLHVEMEMSPDSQIILYGPLLRALISIKVPKC